MHKQTIILIVILAVVTGVLVFLAVTNQNVLKKNQSKVVPTAKVVEKTTKVFFNPTSVSVSSAPISTDIMIDTGGSKIAGVQAELQYDPKAITNVKVNPASDTTGFFGPSATVLFNDVIQASGRISYVIAISPGESGKSGVGKIGTITFTKSPTATSSSTTINFLDKTLVSVLDANDSALKETVPLQITFSNAAPVRTVPLTSPAVTVPVSPTQ